MSHHRLLRRLVEVDQHIADEDAVEPCLGRGRHQVVALEACEGAHLVADAPAIVVALRRIEEASAPRLVHALDRAGTERAFTGLAQGLLADVRSKHVERPVVEAMPILEQTDRDRVRLGAGRAARRPHAQRRRSLAATPRRDDLAQERRREPLEVRLGAEEERLVGRDGVDEVRDLALAGERREEGVVRVVVGELTGAEPASDAVAQQRELVLADADTARAIDEIAEAVELLRAEQLGLHGGRCHLRR